MLVITYMFKWHALWSQQEYSWTHSDLNPFEIQTFFASTHIQTHAGILIRMVSAGLKVSASCDLQDSGCSDGESLDRAGVLYSYWDYETMWWCQGLFDGSRKQNWT